MKKVKLTTMTLALLAGTVVAPIVSTATGVEAANAPATTETAEAPEASKEEEPKADDPAETPAPEKKEDVVATPEATKPAAQKEVAAPKMAEVDPATELADAIEAARAEAYARYTADDITYDFYLQLDARIAACQSVEEVNQQIKWMNDNANAELKAAREEAVREVDALLTAHKITDSSRDAYVTRIYAAGTQEQIDVVLGEARAEAALSDARVAAIKEIQGLVDGYGFTQTDSEEFIAKLYDAKTEAEINAIVAEAHAAAEIGAIRYAGLVQLNELLVAGTITTEEYYIYADQIDVANSQEEVDAIVAAANEFVDLKEYKEEAKYTISDLVHEGKIDQEDYYPFADRIDAATNKAEVDQVLADAQTLVELNEAKVEAKKTVLALAHDELITSGDYWNAVDAIEAATTIEEVNAAVAAAQAIADLTTAKNEAIREVDALLEANKITDDSRDDYVVRIQEATSVEEINAVLAEANAEAALSDARVAAIKEIQGLVDGRGFTNDDALVFIEQLYDAKTIDEIDSIVEAAKAFAELNGAKVLAYDELYALLNEGKLSQADYDEFTALVEAATDVAAIDAALAAAQERVALNEAKELAKEVILELAHAELIDSGEYWDFVNAIDAATSIEEVNSIVDEAHQLAALRQAKIDAKDELFFMLTTGDIDLFDFWHFEEVLENAETLEEVAAVVPAAEALVQARISAENELSAFVDEDLLTNTEFRDFVAQTKEVRSAEEVEAIMVEARALADSRRIEEVTESTITVKFVDAEGNEIKESESLTKEVGYTHLFVAPVVEGYEVEGPSSLELTFSDSPQTITFTYNKVAEEVKEGNITVQYLDKDGKEVKAADKYTKEVGTKEVIEAPAIKGYKLVGPSALKVEFVEIDQTVAFTYEKVKDDSGKEEGNGGKEEGNKGNNKGDNKKEDNKKEDNKKDQLPQTGEAAANAGLVAGGILSMLSAAFVFLRKGK